MTRSDVDITHDELAAVVGRDARLIVEIGANDGEDTAALLATYPCAFVWCFEPDPRPAARWTARLGGNDRCRLLLYAVDDAERVAVFRQSGGLRRPSGDEWDLSGSLCEPTGHLSRSPEITFERSIEVETVTLDAWADAALKGPAVVDLLWVDTQGAEMRVFRGGERTLARTRVVKAECHTRQLYAGAPSEQEMVAYLDARGFDCLGRWADDLLFLRRLA